MSASNHDKSEHRTPLDYLLTAAAQLVHERNGEKHPPGSAQGMADDPAAMARIGDCDGQKMLQLLRSCSGAFRPGILTALVGSSGAGKTTLMDCLAGRKTSPLDVFKPSFGAVNADRALIGIQCLDTNQEAAFVCSRDRQRRRAGVWPSEGAADVRPHHGLRGAE